ncbi:hypothetical protein, partial [Ruminococcus sp.]|uniref:hypothetical protein n=1 Tax=Ruminococcus sp. TaxID=41978 RepID=UPI003FD6E8CC
SFLVAIAFLKANAVVFKPQNCINGKYLWALPTPTTFETVDQTFIIDWQINLLNHNSANSLD